MNGTLLCGLVVLLLGGLVLLMSRPQTRLPAHGLFVVLIGAGILFFHGMVAADSVDWTRTAEQNQAAEERTFFVSAVIFATVASLVTARSAREAVATWSLFQLPWLLILLTAWLSRPPAVVALAWRHDAAFVVAPSLIGVVLGAVTRYAAAQAVRRWRQV